MALFAVGIARALPELAVVHGCICPSAFVLPLGLTSQTFHLSAASICQPQSEVWLDGASESPG